jgi:hypothetical protein
MTLWDRKLGLILGLALLTFACEEPGEIGLDINPENGTFVARYFEIPIKNSITQHEDILSDNSTRVDFQSQNPISDGRLLVGSYSSPEFGTFKSRAFASFSLGQAGFTPEGFTFDSLILYARVEYAYGNNFMGIKKINIHELEEDIKRDSVYLTKNSTPYSMEPIGEFNFDFSSFDTTRIDTLMKARIADELGVMLLDSAQSDTMNFYNNEELRKFFKGLAFVPEDMSGVVAGIHAESQSTFMRMHIHNATDTSFFDFIIPAYTQDTIYTTNSNGEEDTLFITRNFTRYYNSIDLDKTGSPIAGIPGFYDDFETDDDLSYIQGSSGIFTKLNFGSYNQFLDTVKNLVINKAELIIPVVTYEDYLEPSLALDLYLTDESNRFFEVQVDSLKTIYSTIGRVNYLESENSNSGEYLGDVTNYIQALTSGNSTDTLILIGQSSLFNSVLTVNQTVIDKDNILLKIYYSSIN